MAVFENCSVLFDLKNLAFKEKKKLKSAVTENGGDICFVVNKQCSLIVTSDASTLSANRLRSIRKHQTPVVGADYVYSCLKRRVLLPVDEYELDTSCPSDWSPPLPLSSPRRSALAHQVPLSRAAAEPSTGPAEGAETPERSRSILGKFRIYTETDSDLPTYPDSFQVAKYSIFEKINSSAWCVLELQSSRRESGWQYRVVRFWKDDAGAEKAAVRDTLVFLSTSEDALDVYKALRETLLGSGLQLRSNTSPQARHLGSAALQQLLLEEKLNTGSLSQEVGVFVELLWTEALGRLSSILSVPVNKLSLNDVSRVEGLLLQAQRKLKEANHTEVASLLDEVYTLLPLRARLPPNAKLISQNLDLCQLIRDVLSVSEMTLRSPVPSCLGKYRALRCSIEAVPPSSSEFQEVSALLQHSDVQIQRVLRVCRGVELQTFKNDLGNVKPLLHSSSTSNFVGVLSRGLLLPRVGVEHHGIERTDAGNLGSGIYFSDDFSASLKYSRPGVTDGSRLMLVCDVALGRCSDVHKRDLTLTQAPEGHHSVHGVRRTLSTQSEFEDDEYVVYSPDQVRLKYVVQFSVEGDRLQEFSPAVVASAEPCLPPAEQELVSEVNGVDSIRDPLEDVTAGLLDSSGQQLPLQAVHVKCKLMDLLSQVIIFQKYTNLSSAPIEAKYVFPLADSAAVCGFEAFINGKRVVGQVKEKETARKEYKQALEKGHGAYLMDQDAPDVFTISVGNLPPGATVLIKVTFVSELIVRDGSILFSLPGSVAPWQESAALNQTTQVTVKKVCVTDEAANTREFSLDMSVEMPNEISSLKCNTHKVKIKRTDCKAVVSVLPGEVMGPEGFQLSVTLSEVHMPRMWVEKHPDKDSQACMLVFYPEFDVDSGPASDEVVLLLDTSESMKGESLRTAQRIALQVLKTLDHNVRLNVVLFGTDHTEAFLTARSLAEAHRAAESFIKRFSPVGGGTELWRPLRALGLLPPSRGVRNLLLLSDGHVQNAELTLQLLRDNARHSRLFTCGLSQTANRHMLRALAQAGGGAFEFFDTKTKHNWAEKVASQVKRMVSPGCSSVSVKWQQFDPAAPPPVQAPRQLHALFNDCHSLVYGFVPHCTQATLHGSLSGQELKTMVSTSELQKTRGTFLHKLTARALIRDYEDGSLDANEAEHEGKKAELKRFIIELSKEFSILSQFTSFVAIEERGAEQTEGFTDVPKLIAEEDVDFLPYISWTSPQHAEEEEEEEDDDLSSEFDCYDCVKRPEEEVGYSWEFQSNKLPEEMFEGADRDLCEIRTYELPEEMSVSRSLQSRTYHKRTSHAPSPPPPPLSPPQTSASYPVSPPPPPFSDLPVLRSKGLPPPPPPPVSLPAGHSFPPPPPPPPFSDLPVLMSKGPFMPYHATPCGPIPVPPFYGAPMSLQSSVSESLKSPEILDLVPLPTQSQSESSSPGRHLVFGDMRHQEKAKIRCFGLPEFANESHGIECSYSGPTLPLSSLRKSQSRASPAYAPTSPAFRSADSLKPLPIGRRFEAPRLQTTQSDFDFSSYAMRAEFPETSEATSPMQHDSPSPVDGLVLGAAWSQREPETDGVEHRLCLSPPEGKLPRVALKSRRRKYRHRVEQFLESAEPEAPELRWTKIFQMQHSDGFWELTTELGEFINVNVDIFANVFLKSRGIQSLGVRAHADILRLVATLLVLQLMRVEKLEEGKLLRTLFRLDDCSQTRPERWQEMKRAVDWVCWADRQYPCVYSRLEFGLSWESSTRQLLGYEGLPPFSPLRGLNLNLQRTAAPVLVH